jgi:(2Fe-2S) ferredoxin
MGMFEKEKRVAICRGPHCSARDSATLADLLDAELTRHDLVDEVGTRPGACNKLCEEGPSMVVHPDKIWYSGLTPDAVREIVRQHLSGGEPVRRYVARDLSRFGTRGAYDP